MENKIKAGMVMWSAVFEKNVDIVSVYKDTATVRVVAGGIRDGQQLTIRGQRLDTLSPRQQRLIG